MTTETNTDTLRALTTLADASDAIKVANANDAHLDALAKAHTRTIRLTANQSAAWEDDEATRKQITARAQRRANRDGMPWIIVSRRSVLLATVQPEKTAAVADDADDMLDMGAGCMF